jgi:hypothetical protein
MPTVRQHFAGGEVSPEMYGRTDIARYGVSLRTMLNFITTPGGAAKNRPGTKFIAEVQDSTKYTRLVPFVFNSDLSYVLEISPGWMRFIHQGYQIFGWQGVHKGGDDKDWMTEGMTDPTRFWVPGSLVGKRLSNMAAGKQVGAEIASNTSINILTVSDPGFDWDDGDPYIVHSGPGVSGINEIPVPWADGELERLQYAQFNDIMVFVHPAYPPYVLRRYGHDNWTLTPLSVTRPVSPPEITAVSDTGTGGNKRTHTWAATAVDDEGNESLPSYFTPASDRAVYPGDTDTRCDISITAPDKGAIPSTYVIYRGEEGVVGYVQDAAVKAGGSQDVEDRGNAPDYTDTPPQGRDPFVVTEQSVGIGSPVPRTVDFGAPVAGVSVAVKDTVDEAFDKRYEVHWSYDLVGECAATVLIEVDITGVGDAYETVWGPFTQYVQNGHYIGETSKAVNVDGAIQGTLFRMTVTTIYGTQTTTPLRVDWIEQPTAPEEDATTIYPSAVCFFQQRLVMANFQGPDKSEPSTIKTSRIGDIYNFDQSLIAKANDAMVLTLSSLKLDEVRALIPLNSLLCFTAGAEWTVKGVDDAAIGPTNYSLRPNSWYGSSWVVPVVIGRSVIFSTERGRIVRDLQHDPISGALSQGKDLTVMARHMFEFSGLREWAYAETPHSVLWAVRNDGLLLGMTYEPNHDVWAWHRHTTGPVVEEDNTTGYRKVTPRDKFESICTVPEVGENAVYVVVRRTMDGVNGGVPVRYIERLTSREGVVDTADYFFSDSAAIWDGRSTVNPIDLGLPDAMLKVYKTVGATWQAGDTGYTLECDEEILDEATFVDLSYCMFELRVGDLWVRLEVTSLDPEPDNFKVTVKIDSFGGVEGATTVDAALRDTYTADYGRAFNHFGNWRCSVEHLLDEQMSVLVDGATHAQVTTVDEFGAFDLAEGIFGERVVIGIPIQADIETLPVSFPQDPGEIRKREKTVVEVGVELDNWSGLKIGQHLGQLVPIQQRDVRSGYGEVDPARGIVVVRPFNVIEREVAIAFRQDDPLPVTILATSIEVDVETEER